MSCRELVERLGAYLDAELPWYWRWLLRLHLLLCSACRAYVRSYRTTCRLARDASASEGEPALSEDLGEVLRKTWASHSARAHRPDPR